METYLRNALDRVTSDEVGGLDRVDGISAFAYMRELCRRGVRENWLRVSPEFFMLEHLWCVGTAQKRYDVRLKPRAGGSFWDQQRRLFRQGIPEQIVRDATQIRAEYENDASYLSPRMVASCLWVAEQIESHGWNEFKRTWLLLPEDPETKSLTDWFEAKRMLDALPGVGDATAWYLIRNLYGAPVFKPDVHINACASYFFPSASDGLSAMTEEVNRLWPVVCKDERLLPIHLGEIDYVMWRYRSLTGLPR